MNPNDAQRIAFRDHLTELMRRDPAVVCVDTDTGIFKATDFGDAAERYVNLGIAEQNAMGVAAGLAASGRRPYVTTMAAFAASRAAEAVKLDIAYNRLPVRIVATHGGVAAGHFGPTHHALEDLAVMRSLPHMTVVVPGDAWSAVSLLGQAEQCPGPVYVRLGRKPTPPLPPTDQPDIGRLQEMHPAGGTADAVIVATGPLPVLRALAAAEQLRHGGIRVAVLQAHTLKPFDTTTLLRRCARTRLVVTVEEHWRVGGLGSAVAEALAERSGPPPVLRLGFPDAFVTAPGTQEQLLDAAGLSVSGIAARVRRSLHAEDLVEVS
ncbi:transketolase family protein [Streptomyces sp. NPDC003247]|uniref:transketolase family protein n=1 Tax=Streptomyces sp. NPDC003247 TaxID=3364677 RepID=UPI0036A41C1B